MSSKVCNKCKEEKPIDSFVKSKASKGGRSNECKQCKNARAKSARDSNPDFSERCKSASRKWKLQNTTSTKKYQSSWKKKNRAHCTAQQVERYTAQKQRTVSWANEQLIAAYYKEAKRLEELTGIKFHVDHIIPLQGELVSGLHVETNLQLLPAHENLGKSNSFDPDLFVA